MRKILKLNSDGGKSCSMKGKRGYGGTCGGVQRSLALVGVQSKEASFVLMRLAEIWLQLPLR
jgi:hypothetical protein